MQDEYFIIEKYINHLKSVKKFNCNCIKIPTANSAKLSPLDIKYKLANMLLHHSYTKIIA
jgi:hypothetical protein